MTADDYRAALDKIRSAPLTLTETDFAVLEEFNPADERRGRDALRRAQLASLHTKAARTPANDPTVLADAIYAAIRMALAPVVARVRALETATGNVGPHRAPAASLEAQLAHIDEQCDQQLRTFMDDVAAGLVTDQADRLV